MSRIRSGMSIQALHWHDLKPCLSSGDKLELYTEDMLPHYSAQPEELKSFAPKDTIVTGSFQAGGTLSMKRGDATISMQPAPEFLQGLLEPPPGFLKGSPRVPAHLLESPSAFEKEIQKNLDLDDDDCVGDYTHVIIGNHPDAPTLARDVLERILQSYKAVAILGSRIYKLPKQNPLKRDRDTDLLLSDQQSSKHLNT